MYRMESDKIWNMNDKANHKNPLPRVFFLLAIGLVAGCLGDHVVPFVNAPDYSDDYSRIWEPKFYKQWGTYNVHDPSCIKAGEYYYMYSTDAIYFRERPRMEDFF